MKMYPYEGMFLLDPTKHGADTEGTEKVVTDLLKKHGATIHQAERWDDRKLAYEIKGHRRGIYYLTYFNMPGPNVDTLRNDAKLDETILRMMVIRLEDEVPVYLEKSAKYYEKMREHQERDRDRGDRGDRDRGDRGPRRDDAPRTTEEAPAAPAAAPATEQAAE